MSNGEERKEPIRDAMIATMFRTDIERVAALRRAVSGKTRCPECDAVNPANQRRCDKCGSLLYPELRDEEERKEHGEQD